MLSRIGRLLGRNFRSDVCTYLTYQSSSSRLVHNVQKKSNNTAISGMELQSFLKPNPTRYFFILKPSPLIEPDSINSRILDLPFPFSRISVPVNMWDPFPEVKINEPPQDTANEKQAARLIVIRRQKMKKHKLKKLRKKMKFEWAKVRQRRELRKEKLFQAKLVTQMKGAEQFDAAEYVAEKLRKVEEFSQLEQEKRKFKKKM